MLFRGIDSTYAVTPLIIVKRNGVASVIDAALIFLTTIEAEPAAGIASHSQQQAFVAPTCLTITISVAAMNVFVSVNVEEAAAATAALYMVIVPHNLLSVTPVVRLDPCVTVPPAPEAYPIPAPEEVIAPVAARDVPTAAPIFGVVREGETNGALAAKSVVRLVTSLSGCVCAKSVMVDLV